MFDCSVPKRRPVYEGALIKLLQEKYLIWSDLPFLHHLAADGEALKQQVCRLAGAASAPKKITPCEELHMYLAREEILWKWIQIEQLILMLEDETGLFSINTEGTQTSTRNSSSHKHYHSRMLRCNLVTAAHTRALHSFHWSGQQRLITYMLQQQLLELQLLPQLQWELIDSGLDIPFTIAF